MIYAVLTVKGLPPEDVESALETDANTAVHLIVLIHGALTLSDLHVVSLVLNLFYF